MKKLIVFLFALVACAPQNQQFAEPKKQEAVTTTTVETTTTTTPSVGVSNDPEPVKDEPKKDDDNTTEDPIKDKVAKMDRDKLEEEFLQLSERNADLDNELEWLRGAFGTLREQCIEVDQDNIRLKRQVEDMLVRCGGR